MKTQILLTLMLVASCINVVFSQCKAKKDEFTGESVIEYHDDNKFTRFDERKGKITIELTEQYQGRLGEIVPKGTEVMLKLGSGDIIKLVTNIEAVSKAEVYGDGVYTKYNYVCDIDKESVSKMAISKVVVIRFPDAKGGFKDVDCTSGIFEKQRAKSISKGAKCIMGIE